MIFKISRNKICIVLISVLTLVSITSCSKDARINNRLEGNWNMVEVNGQTLPNQYYTERTFVFEQSKSKTGKVSVKTKPTSGADYNFFGTYTLNNRGDLHIVATDDYGISVVLNYHIEKIKSDKITWKVISSGVEEKLEK